mmetsp:Transcript_11107/g.22805  ORF Transcript_11107/g.22805 Transcript_11107/m.22805 type:complete len:383 (-) Transcript_11107:7-1155(-)
MAKLRPLPVTTEINIFLLNLAFAIIHFVLAPFPQFESVISAFCVGNLFGIIGPFIGVVWLVLHVIVRPILNYLVYDGVYHDIFISNTHSWIIFLVSLNLIVAFTDKSHKNVHGADYRRKNNIFARAAEKFFDATFNYIPMTIVPWDEDHSTKSSKATLPPNRQYIFAVHPHGIHCMPLSLFHRKGSEFDKRFPGICEKNLSGLVATVMFKIPGVRELFLSLPYIDASRSVAEEALRENRSLFVCTGSGEESLLTKRGEDVLVLSKRKGFIRLALSYGCDIVPIFGVGNSDLFETYNFGATIRMWLHKRLHVSIPIFHGRYFTPLPYRVPIRVLVGEPLKVPQPQHRGEKPDEEIVEKYLKQYIEQVKELHKRHSVDRILHIV